MRTYFAEWRVSPGKCRSRTVESKSDPRERPGRENNRQQQRLAPVEEVTPVGTAPAFARVGEALDMVRAGLGYLAAADAAQLAAATQAECLRELEQAGAVATAARAAVLAAFTAGQGYAGDAEYSAVSWLMHRTGITRGAAVGHAAWAGRTRTHPQVVAALAAGQVSGVGGAADLLVDEPAAGEVPGRVRRAAARGRGGRAGAGGAGVAGRGDVRAGPRRPAGRGPGRRVHGPRREAGDHVRRRRRGARGPDAGMRRGGRRGAGRAVRPGRERGRPDEGPAVPRRAGRGDAPPGRR